MDVSGCEEEVDVSSNSAPWKTAVRERKLMHARRQQRKELSSRALVALRCPLSACYDAGNVSYYLERLCYNKKPAAALARARKRGPEVLLVETKLANLAAARWDVFILNTLYYSTWLRP